MCPIVDGMSVDAANTNAQLLDAVGDDTATGIITLANTDVASGATVTSVQKELNSDSSYTGKPLNSVYNVLPTWTNNDVGASTDTLRLRSDNLTAKFNASTGHTHTGAAGDAPPVLAASISTVPKRGYIQQGTDLTGVTGTSTIVTTQMSGKSPSSGPTVAGVVVTAPENKLVIRQATGANQDDVYVDGSGNVVYGRITEAATVWTLSYYVNLSGTETAYSFSSSDVRWYYQELYNPLSNPPVYSEFASIPSDNATSDVITATTSLQGKTSLSAATPAEVAATGSAGTANASVANADHAHKGVHSFAKSGSTLLYGDVTVSGSSNILATQTSQDVSFSITGAIPIANGGTGQSSTPTNGQLLIGGTAGSDFALSTITGTANQLNVTNGNHSITLSTPQDIATSSTPQFAALGINAANSTVKVDINGDIATRRQTDNSSAGALNDVSTTGSSFTRFTAATSITGLAGGYTGKHYFLTNATGSSITVANDSASSTAANRIYSGTGADISLQDKATLILIYDDSASRWRVAGGTSGTGGSGFTEDGNFNLFAGTTALADNTTSQYNVAIGHQAAQHILGSGTTGDNIAIGHLALQGASTFVATNNVAIGANTLKAITTGTSNVAIGASGTVGQAITTGSDNVFLGRRSGESMTTGSANIAIGVIALGAMTTSGALGSANIGIGQSALGAATTGAASNIAIGSTAMSGWTTGAPVRNIAMGNAAMGGSSSSTGSENVAIGANCLRNITTGTNNFAAIGAVASSSSALGSLTTGTHNCAIGNNAGQSVTTGGNNISLGQLSLNTASTTSDCVAIGRSAIEKVTTANNVAIGGLAGKTATAANALTTGTDATFVGFGTGPAVVGAIGFSFMTAIGSGALVATANTVVLGRTTDSVCIGATGTNASSTAQTQLTGSLSLLGIATKTTTYTALISDDTLIVDATSAAFTVTLYSAAVSKGKSITFKKKDSTANAVTIATVSSQNIDGATTYSLTGQYNSITLVSDGTQFWVV